MTDYLTPQAVAFVGLCIAWVMPPIMAAALAVDHGPARWVSRVLALVLLGAWIPLALGLPPILRAMLANA